MKRSAKFINGRTAAALLLLLAPIDLSSQSPPQTAEIHVSTHLVQIGVIARDSHGPAQNLTRDDFAVFDRGKLQKISVFTAESAASALQPGSSQPLPSALAPNTFSDLPQYGTDKPRSVTIVLLDNLNTLSGNGHETLRDGACMDGGSGVGQCQGASH